MKKAFFLCLLLVSLGTAHAAAPPPQWLPQDSWPGGRQYDPRLERTVTFWGTGVPAADLFASITEQTDVALGFDPPDDDNARICLNVYLNPKEPPALRDVLVQIGWVMDCAWAVEGGGEQRRYVLLHTSIGDGVTESLRAEAAARAAARSMESRRAKEESWKQSLARLEGIRGALGLTREEAVRRYRGRDDLSLLTLLDPARRAVVRFLYSLPGEPLGGMRSDRGVGFTWSELTEEQRAALRQAMQPWVEERLRHPEADPPGRPIQWDDWGSVESLGLTVSLVASDNGCGIGGWVRFRMGRPPDGSSVRYGTIAIPSLFLAPDLRSVGEVAVALESALGEQLSRDEERRVAREARTRAERELWQHRGDVQFARLCVLSPEGTAALAALPLPLSKGDRYALWQVQEAAAAASGLHVISDHFWQPQTVFDDVFGRAALGGDGPPAALHAIQEYTVPFKERDGALRDSLAQGFPARPYSEVGWEWGDAGRFLRFRSTERDVWRGALLPRPVIESVDHLLAPYLPQVAEEPLPDVEVAFDPHWYGSILARLTTLQAVAGPLLPTRNSESTTGAYTAAFWQWSQQIRLRARYMYQLLGLLSEDEWQRLQSEGLTWGIDVPLDRVQVLAQDANSAPVEAGDRMTVDRETPADSAQSQLLWVSGTQSIWLAYRDRIGFEWHCQLPLSITLRPQRLPHLVPPPPEYAQ